MFGVAAYMSCKSLIPEKKRASSCGERGEAIPSRRWLAPLFSHALPVNAMLGWRQFYLTALFFLSLDGMYLHVPLTAVI